MLSKPFRPPLLRKAADNHNQDDQPSVKRRRISEEDTNSEPPTRPITTPLSRKPLVALQNSPRLPQQNSEAAAGYEGYYLVLWRKYTAKKHKTWDGDGVLSVRGGYASLLDISGREMGRLALDVPLLPGSTLSINGKDIEVDSMISKADFLTGKPFSTAKKPPAAPAISMTGSQVAIGTSEIHHPVISGKPKASLQAQMKAAMLKEREESKTKLNVVAPRSQGMKTGFKTPLKDGTVVTLAPGKKPVPRHDPHAPGALVMKRPRKVPKGVNHVVDVVVDPLLAKQLREHQREGVAFLYECVMGIRDYGGEGCILADEMGLGKTLQTIALLWTLLKQNPIYNAEPIIKKALIVCPVTLINNWQKEFRKWLGNERIGVFVADGKKTRLTDFTMGKSYNVMIIGYERLRSVAEDLAKGAGIDIIIADEGHRLKTVQNKSAQAIQSLNTRRRVILSGTPIQNDLSEFFCIVNFVNDGLLGTYKQFMKNFENPIVKSRQPDAMEKDIEIGEFRSEELAQQTSKFILRRTADLLSKYLPPKTEYVLFCEPTPTQASIYRHVLASPIFQSALGSSESALQLISILKKLCNSPSLLSPKVAVADDTANVTPIHSLLETLPQHLLKALGPQASIKIRILDTFLYTLSKKTGEKIVLVSNYTSTLDLLQTLLASLSLPFLRLDGSTPATKRQGLVDDFNRSPSTAVFAFLLSAKAGGMGLNLIGASRLVILDVDWNPAIEEQAMARIHREGQKKHCRIYRFVMKGTLEERVWERQIVKRSLASSIMQGGGGNGGSGTSGRTAVAQFSREELRDLFRLDESPGLRTHELIGCACHGKGKVGVQPEHAHPEPNDQSVLVEGSGNGSRAITISEQGDDDADDADSESLPDLQTLVRHPSTLSSLTEVGNRKLRIPSGTHVDDHQAQAQAQAEGKMNGGAIIEKEKTESKDMEVGGLMEYSHINTSPSALCAYPRHGDGADGDGFEERVSGRLGEMDTLIDDDILMEVLRGDGDGDADGDAGSSRDASGIAWVFKKTSGCGKL